MSLEPCHHRRAVGPMAGVVTPSMWVFVLEDPDTGARTHCTLNEGLGKVLRYGAYSPDVLTRLRWMGDVLGPLLQRAVRAAEPVDVTAILGQMLQMGDEAHNRNRAGTLMLLRDLGPALVSSGADAADVAEVLRFVGGNDHFFLNLAMPACKLALDAARDVPGSTMVVAMSRNGTDFGIQVSGTGDEWFTGPAQVADGLYLGDYGPDDANPDIGDSAITETAGLGGFAMATAPAIVRFVGGSVPDALATTRRMREITLGDNPRWSVPVLEFAGVPTGIDVSKVCRTGILPQINTGMAGPRGRGRPGRRRTGDAAGEHLPGRADPARRSSRGSGRPPERLPEVDVARGPQRRALLEVGLPRLVLVARRQRPVGAHDAPPRHRSAVRGHHRPDEPRASPADQRPDDLRDRAVRRDPAARHLLDAAEHQLDVRLVVEPALAHRSSCMSRVGTTTAPTTAPTRAAARPASQNDVGLA